MCVALPVDWLYTHSSLTFVLHSSGAHDFNICSQSASNRVTGVRWGMEGRLGHEQGHWPMRGGEAESINKKMEGEGRANQKHKGRLKNKRVGKVGGRGETDWSGWKWLTQTGFTEFS